jgi:hypothetical protein
MPELVELHDEWSGKGVRVQAVSIDLPDPVQVSTLAELGAFVERRGFALPHAAVTGDWDAFIERHDLPGGPPYTLLVDRAGAIVERIDGAAERAEFEAALERHRPAGSK